MRGQKDSEEKRNAEGQEETGVSQEGAAGWGQARLRTPEKEAPGSRDCPGVT